MDNSVLLDADCLMVLLTDVEDDCMNLKFEARGLNEI